MWIWISVGVFLLVGEIMLRAIPVLERRYLERHQGPPDWSIFSSYFDLSNAMSEWRHSTIVSAEEIMENPMPRLLDLCFSGEDSGPVRARSMEFFREWANGLEEDQPGMKQRSRTMIVERLETAADQTWLLDVFDGKLSHHGAPRIPASSAKSPWSNSPGA